MHLPLFWQACCPVGQAQLPLVQVWPTKVQVLAGYTHAPCTQLAPTATVQGSVGVVQSVGPQHAADGMQPEPQPLKPGLQAKPQMPLVQTPEPLAGALHSEERQHWFGETHLSTQTRKPASTSHTTVRSVTIRSASERSSCGERSSTAERSSEPALKSCSPPVELAQPATARANKSAHPCRETRGKVPTPVLTSRRLISDPAVSH